MKPDISIFTSGNRPENWILQFENIGENDVNWERIILGPNTPSYTLPDNHRFVQTNVKPAQCFEAAARMTKGEFIMALSDDLIFHTSHPLDVLYETIQSPPDGLDNDKLMVSPRVAIDWGTHVEDCSRHPTMPCHHVFVDNPESPMLAASELYRRELHMALGGYDSRFISGTWDQDLQLRVQAIGGRIILAEVLLAETPAINRGNPSVNGIAPHGYGPHDREELFLNWWKINRIGATLDLHRLVPFVPFTDDKILEVSQGPKGRWD